MSKLTPKQAAFVDNKVAGLTNRAAAIAAGYPKAAAQQTATKLMAHPGVVAAIKAATKSASVDTKPANVPTMPRGKYTDPVTFLEDVMNHHALPLAVRADAAKQLLPYKHARLGEQGKKAKAKDAAQDRVVTGKRSSGRPRLAPKQPPKLHLIT